MSKPLTNARYMNARKAADYCGMCENSFRANIAAHIPKIEPPNLKLVLYDTIEIDSVMASLNNIVVYEVVH